MKLGDLMLRRSSARAERGTPLGRSLRFFQNRHCVAPDADEAIILQLSGQLSAEAKERVPPETAAAIRRYLVTSGSLPGYFIRANIVQEYLQLRAQKDSGRPCSRLSLDHLESLNDMMNFPVPVQPASLERAPGERRLVAQSPDLSGMPAVESSLG